MTKEQALETYVNTTKNGPGATADFASTLSDELAKQIYDALSTNKNTSNLLVKTLWYNYKTQTYRWGDK